MSASLLWFKSKLMRLVTNGKWEPFRRTASAYYRHCMVINEAMGLWILHYWDIDTIIKKEDDDIKKENNDIEEEGTSKQDNDNINKHSSETEDDSNDKNDNKDDNNKKGQKRNHSHVCMEVAEI